MAMSGLALSGLAPDQRKAVFSAVGAELKAADQKTLAALLTTLPPEG